MSNISNELLLEDAKFHMDYWAGTLWEKLIQHAIDQQDYDELRSLCSQSWSELHSMEYRPALEVY